MAPRLIINADDFGLTPGVNRSIEELHRAGVLTSATLMANGPAFADAIAVALRNPTLGVGCHIVLTDGVPLSPPASIPSLLGPDRHSLRPSLLAFAAAALTGQLRRQDIYTEALAQVRKLQRANLHVTHLDTHKHAHLFPAVSEPLLELARHLSVPAIRNPLEQPWSLSLGHGTRLRRFEIRLLNMLARPVWANRRPNDISIATTDGTLGIAATGSLDATSLTELLNHFPDGTWELVCHPGYNDPDLARSNTRLQTQREVEHAALLSVIPRILQQPNAPTLIHFGDLPSAAQ